ncbi:hypothetical protein PZ01_03485 [Lacticaseibacillus rhamnosus]|nr:hypothetical protein PZ01_03485 [Lacticaseibacillus rhamnosus]
MPRDFRFGNRTMGLTAGIFLLCVFLFVFFMSTVPDPHLIAEELAGHLPKGTASPIGTLLYNVLGVVIFMGVAWIYWDRYEKRERLAKAKPVVH